MGNMKTTEPSKRGHRIIIATDQSQAGWYSPENINGQQADPFFYELNQMVSQGQLTRKSLVSGCRAWKKWKTASMVSYITPVFDAVTTLDDTPPTIA